MPRSTQDEIALSRRFVECIHSEPTGDLRSARADLDVPVDTIHRSHR